MCAPLCRPTVAVLCEASYGKLKTRRACFRSISVFGVVQATLTVERVGRRIAEASGLRGCQWEFIVVKDDNMNAFVLPGGKVSKIVQQ